MLFVFITALFISFPALAQDSTHVVDFTDLTLNVFSFLMLLLGMAGTLFYKKYKDKYNLDKIISEEKYNQMLDKVLDEATEYGVGKIKSNDWTKLKTKNEAVAFAANYAVDHGRTLLKDIDHDRLIEKLEAKMTKHDKALGVWEDDKTE